MTTTPRIIVAIGGPKAEHPAIDWALDYAPTAGAEVELLHVVDLSWRTNPSPFAEAALLAAEEELRDLAALYSQRSGQVVHSSIALGRPVEQIVERGEHASSSFWARTTTGTSTGPCSTRSPPGSPAASRSPRSSFPTAPCRARASWSVWTTPSPPPHRSPSRRGRPTASASP
ncbi:MAG: universal stress protein [Actinobacteria bacterium]|nr:universal stress protein [Actinomycetota bacterium]